MTARDGSRRTGLGPTGALSPVRAARRVVDLLRAVGDAPPEGLTVQDLVAATGLPRATLLRYLLTLEEEHWIHRDPRSGRYVLGFGIPGPAQFVARLTRGARPSLERLRERSGENAVLAMLEDDHVAVLDVAESPRALRVSTNPHDRNPIHCTSFGKAIASQLPEPAVRRLLGRAGMPALTERTLTTPDGFLRDIAAARERGFAIADCEHEANIRGISVPIPVSRAQVAISVSGPAMRFPLDDLATVAAILQHEAEIIAHVVRMEAQGVELPSR